MKRLTVIVELKDYHEIDLNKKFDRITSLGMFKHVCYKNYRTFF
ncbi:class I SAM-dependent methyltransferase [Candidatus Coxiella mudrowiae]